MSSVRVARRWHHHAAAGAVCLQVGLITYGTHVQVHELGFTECAKSYVFRGSKEYTPTQVAQQLGVAGPARGGPPGQPGAGGAAGESGIQIRFRCPLQ